MSNVGMCVGSSWAEPGIFRRHRSGAVVVSSRRPTLSLATDGAGQRPVWIYAPAGDGRANRSRQEHLTHGELPMNTQNPARTSPADNPAYRLPCQRCASDRELVLHWNRHDQIKVICATCRAYIKFAAINPYSIALCVNKRPDPGQAVTGIPTFSMAARRSPSTGSLFGGGVA